MTLEERTEEAVKAIDKATMKLTGYGENNTGYLQKPRKLIADQTKRIKELEEHIATNDEVVERACVEGARAQHLLWSISYDIDRFRQKEDEEYVAINKQGEAAKPTHNLPP